MKTEFFGIEYSPEAEALWVHVIEIDPAARPECDPLNHFTVVVPRNGDEPYLDGHHERAGEIIRAGVASLPQNGGHIAHYMEPLR